MQKRDPLKKVGFFIRCSKLNESAKSWKFLSSGVILNAPNNITFLYVAKYMETLLDKLSKNTVLLWSGIYMNLLSTIFSNGGLFLEKQVLLSYLCEFSRFTRLLSLTDLDRPPPKLYLSCLNMLYPAKRNWLFRKELLILVSDTENILNAL